MDDKTYLIAYTLVDYGEQHNTPVYTDVFEVFRAGETNSKQDAEDRYDEILELDSLYTANLTEVLQSTDY